MRFVAVLLMLLSALGLWTPVRAEPVRLVFVGDVMLDDGLPYANIGHGRWITGQALIEYMNMHSETKASQPNESA